MTLTPPSPDERGALLDGKAVGAQIRAEVAAGVAELVERAGRPPGLTAVLVGDDPASQVYVGSKTRGCAEVGMVGATVRLPATVSQVDLAAEVDRLNADPAVDGILIQLPLPAGLDVAEIQTRVDPAKDVDGLHPLNAGRLWLERETLAPATPAGIVELLGRYGFELGGKHAVIVGRSAIVGKPMAALLLARHCTITICHSRTRDLAAVCSRADLLVVAAGRVAMIGPEHVRDGAWVIDVGMNSVADRSQVERLFPGNDKRLETLERRGAVLVGDVDFTRVRPRAAAITPVPGGVGPLTIAHVLANTLTAARRREGLAAAGPPHGSGAG
ncbi:MAG TPA: bifunctional 5,10-methylenetetrahydrofolate dehydrogenase/5,10-methenyltetrahydrofolate cyclohydrolase [Thermoanaerobaculia bacterium]|nr:bifunctional 5,10-methylenetetrahydrofolate dehydrogenase/5,10-methenyltetrahydrofolate cyclohydrolase [Thermoanaerobaculia bacterium]